MKNLNSNPSQSSAISPLTVAIETIIEKLLESNQEIVDFGEKISQDIMKMASSNMEDPSVQKMMHSVIMDMQVVDKHNQFVENITSMLESINSQLQSLMQQEEGKNSEEIAKQILETMYLNSFQKSFSEKLGIS